MSELRDRSFRRILLIKPSAVGDVVHALPVLVKLRARYPDARIDWLITPENADLVRHHPDVSNLVLFPRRGFGRTWTGTLGPLRLVAALRRGRYDLVIDLHGQFRSAACALATAAPVRIGFDRPVRRESRAPEIPGQHGWSGAREGSWLTSTHRIAIPTLDVHAVDRYLWLSPMLGLDDAPPDFRVTLTPEALAENAALLRARGVGVEVKPLAVLVPGTIWETKHWHVEGFAAVGRHLLASDYAVVLAGTARDLPRSRAIAERASGVVDLCGQTPLAGLVALIRRAALCVTNDSGSMHLAVAEGVPVVSVFGPTSSHRIGPYGRPRAVVEAGVPCAPCYLRRLRDCPHHHACMTGVSGAMVVERIEEVLAGFAGAAGRL